MIASSMNRGLLMVVMICATGLVESEAYRVISNVEMTSQQCWHVIVKTGFVLARCDHRNFTEVPDNLKKNIQALDATYNNIRSLEDDTFEFYPNLEYILLGNNLIQNITKRAFSSMENLRVLNLSQNSLREFPNSILAISTLPRLEKLYLSKNYLRDGSLDFPAAMGNSNVKTLDLSNNFLDSFPHLLHLPQLTVLNIAKNSINMITTKDLERFPSLKMLDVSDNPIMFNSYDDCDNFNDLIAMREIQMIPDEFYCLNFVRTMFGLFPYRYIPEHFHA